MKVVCPVCNQQMNKVGSRCVCGYEIHEPAAPPSNSKISREEIGHMGIALRDIFNGIEITIQTKVHGLVYVFFGIKSIGWGIVEAFGIWIILMTVNVHDLSDMGKLLLAGIGIWTIIGMFIMHEWLWKLKGKEVIVLTPSKLTIKKDIFGCGCKRVYDLNRMRNLLVSYEGEGREGNPSGGSIIFEYDSNMFRFGLSLTEQEAQFIVSELYKRHHFQAG